MFYSRTLQFKNSHYILSPYQLRTKVFSKNIEYYSE